MWHYVLLNSFKEKLAVIDQKTVCKIQFNLQFKTVICMYMCVHAMLQDGRVPNHLCD